MSAWPSNTDRAVQQHYGTVSYCSLPLFFLFFFSGILYIHKETLISIEREMKCCLHLLLFRAEALNDYFEVFD